MGIRCEDMVFTHQTHTTNVRVVTEADKGCGIVKPRTYSDVDGLVTDIPGICLVTFYADCVPLYFVDPVKKVIGLRIFSQRSDRQSVRTAMRSVKM